MATLKEERARLQFLEEHGHGDEKVHVVFVEREAQERIKNEAKGFKLPKTRFQWETDIAEGYAELNKGKDRLIRLVVNKQVAVSIAAKLWLLPSDKAIMALVEAGAQANEGGE
jgi:hypothetical protein